MGRQTRAMHCRTILGQWVVELLLYTAALPGQWVADLLWCIVALPAGSW